MPDELPDVFVKSAEFIPDLDKRPGITDSGTDLQFVADNTGIVKQLPDLVLPVLCYFVEIEIIEGLTVGGTLA